MEELPLAVQLKLREMPGAETGVQVVDLLLEDGRVVPEVRVMDCTFAEEGNFEPEMVADVRVPTAPPSPRRALLALLWLLLGILAVFALLWAITPESQRQ
ncbi:MAG: hypothetical protein ACRD4D_09165 [Candidatus Acidiferrales bacterium]